jgi:hypothetical protein
MTSLSLVPNLDRVPVPALPPGPYDANVVKTAPLMVTIPAFDLRHEWGPCTLAASSATAPVVGESVCALVCAGTRPVPSIWILQEGT